MVTKKVAGSTSTPTKAKTPASKSSGTVATATGAAPFEASGAPAQSSGKIEASHPAVDADPRADTTADQNRIDFNDPTKSGSETVAENLRQQGVTTKDENGDH